MTTGCPTLRTIEIRAIVKSCEDLAALLRAAFGDHPVVLDYAEVRRFFCLASDPHDTILSPGFLADSGVARWSGNPGSPGEFLIDLVALEIEVAAALLRNAPDEYTWEGS